MIKTREEVTEDTDDEMKYTREEVSKTTDVDEALKMVTERADNFYWLPKVMKDNKLVVLTTLKGDALNLYGTSDRLKDDEEVIVAAMMNDPSNFGCASPRLKKREKEIFTKVLTSTTRKRGLLFAASKSLCNDKDFVMKVVKKYPQDIRYASDVLKDDKEVCFSAIASSGEGEDEVILLWVSNRLRNDKVIVLSAMRKNNYNFIYAGEKAQADRDIVTIAVATNARNLKYAAPKFRNDKEMIMAAMENNETVLCYASKGLKENKELFLYAIKKCAYTLRYASDSLLDDKEVVLLALSQRRYGYDLLCYASERLRNDKEIVLVAVRNNPWEITYASESCRNDVEVATEAVNAFPSTLYHFHDEIKNNYDIVSEAVSIEGLALEYASKELQDNDALVAIAVDRDIRALKHASKRLKLNQNLIEKAMIGLLEDFSFHFPTFEEFDNYDNYEYDLNYRYSDIIDSENANRSYIDYFYEYDHYNDVYLVQRREHFHGIREFIGKLITEPKKLGFTKPTELPVNTIHVSAIFGVSWDEGIKKLIEDNPSWLEKRDDVTGLLPFMIYAIDFDPKLNHNIDLTTLYEMIRTSPTTLERNHDSDVFVSKKRNHGSMFQEDNNKRMRELDE